MNTLRLKKLLLLLILQERFNAFMNELLQLEQMKVINRVGEIERL